ncbi:hypothetical protein F441_01295 [Phytophthora nicotianae CJ01A1]|uniref:Uncharacterized protein n=1 Tax=Phytophthora nicotianae CJ01A1 TaxID=1317063 RepID=W2XTZ3_PHYNI|nr:hypothetical protein F441_01295 [Phytophthora nicotianae CJ01A1]
MAMLWRRDGRARLDAAITTCAPHDDTKRGDITERLSEASRRWLACRYSRGENRASGFPSPLAVQPAR